MRDAFKKLGEAIGDIAGEAAEKIQDAAETVGEKAKEFKDDPYRFIPKQKPSVGRIVQLTGAIDTIKWCWPAIITRVHDEDTVDVFMFNGDTGQVELIKNKTFSGGQVKWPEKV